MSLLFHVLYAVHAKGTHHKLALDGLHHLEGEYAERWRRLFLKHATVYLEGAKAPDTEFKDFKNHVLHVRDGFWGGAPAKARSWYTHLVEALRAQDWRLAAYCAGVLSHYVTDPMQPFHTAQSEAENSIHRAAEWSISKAYDNLKALCPPEPDIAIPNAENWLEVVICDAATEANRYYEKLIAHYDIHRGVSDPPSGLDLVSRRIIASLLARAAATLGAVIDRATAEAGVTPPTVSLSVESVLATLKIPIERVANRIADADERRLLHRMYDELIATGTVEKNLPEDDRTVRDLHAAEVLAQRPSADASKAFPLRPAASVETTVRRRQRALENDASATSVPRGVPLRTVSAAREVAPAQTARIYLTPEHDIVDAPSIGPKTAARLNAVGVDTVDDLLKAHPIALAARLDDRYVTEQIVTDWQDQARLVCTVPGLRGTGAQLLVGAGYRTATAVAQAEVDALCAGVLAFAGQNEGQRILRDGDPPDIEKIRSWMEEAQQAEAA